MKASRWVGVLVVSVVAPGCGSDVDEAPVCPTEVAVAVERFQCIADAVAELLDGMVRHAAEACVAIASDLGESPPAITEPLTEEQVTAVCSLARAAVDAVVADVGCASLTITDGDCTVDPNGQAQCEAGCEADDAACDACCETLAPYDQMCMPITVVVDTADPTLQATLEANLPALVPLSMYDERVADLVARYTAESVEVVGLVERNEACRESYSATVVAIHADVAAASNRLSEAMEVAKAVSGAADCEAP